MDPAASDILLFAAINSAGSIFHMLVLNIQTIGDMKRFAGFPS